MDFNWLRNISSGCQVRRGSSGRATGRFRQDKAGSQGPHGPISLMPFVPFDFSFQGSLLLEVLFF